MKRRSRVASIDEDVPYLLVDVVAETVVETAERLSEKEIPRDAIPWLAHYARDVYAHSADFRKKIQSEANRGNAGRDWLYSFMEHWLGAYLKKNAPDILRSLPSGYGWSYSPSLHGRR